MKINKCHMLAPSFKYEYKLALDVTKFRKERKTIQQPDKAMKL